MVPFYKVSNPEEVEGHMTLRRILYEQITLSDGCPLISEQHQANALADLDIVRPNTAEAEAMVREMEKNVAAYLSNYLTGVKKLEKSFVDRLVRASVKKMLVGKMEQCTFDNRTIKLITPRDAEREKLEAIENAAWYNNTFDMYTPSG